MRRALIGWIACARAAPPAAASYYQFTGTGDRAAIAKLSLTFAPEPGRAVLLTAGLALALLGGSRRRCPNVRVTN